MLGSVEPTRRLAPERVKTLGPQGRAFARKCGIACMPWQDLVIDDWLAVRPDGRWAAREAALAVSRQQGKSVCAVIRLMCGLFLFREQTIVYTAHEVATALEIFGRVVKTIEKNPDLSRRMVGKPRRSRGSEEITLCNPDQRLLIKARSKGGGRGFSGDVIFFDEAQMGLDEDDLAALGPTQRAMPNPQTLFMGTPPIETGTYWALNVRKRSFDGDPRLSWHEWSPPEWFDPNNPEHLDDRDVWAATNPAYGILLTDEAIEQDRKNLGSKFATEALGYWPREKTDGWAVIPRESWEAAHDSHSRLLDPVCFAMATDLDRNWTSIAAAGRRADGLWHVEVIDRRPSVAWSYPRIAELLARWRNCGLVIVASGPTGALIPDIEARTVGDRAGGKPIEVVKASVQDFAKACGMFHTGLTGEAGPDEPDPKRFRWRCASEYRGAVDAAVRDAARKATGDVWTFERDLEGVDTDTSPLEAMAAALWGFASFGQNAPNAPVTVSADLRAQAGNFFRPQGRLKL
jgi:hypothetical protein